MHHFCKQFELFMLFCSSFFFLPNWVKENEMCRDQRLATFLAASAASLYPDLHISGMCKDLRRKQKKKKRPNKKIGLFFNRAAKIC